jgi:hypothetical protein
MFFREMLKANATIAVCWHAATFLDLWTQPTAVAAAVVQATMFGDMFSGCAEPDAQ